MQRLTWSGIALHGGSPRLYVEIQPNPSWSCGQRSRYASNTSAIPGGASRSPQSPPSSASRPWQTLPNPRPRRPTAAPRVSLWVRSSTSGVIWRTNFYRQSIERRPSWRSSTLQWIG
jgi:hypothetical protein